MLCEIFDCVTFVENIYCKFIRICEVDTLCRYWIARQFWQKLNIYLQQRFCYKNLCFRKVKKRDTLTTKSSEWSSDGDWHDCDKCTKICEQSIKSNLSFT